MPMKRFIPVCILFACLSSGLVQAEPPEELSATVEYLLGEVARSEAVFIRNGKEHTPAGAAEHICKKYQHFKEQIKTGEDFIRLSATQSLVSKKPYTIRFPDGKTIPTAEYLLNLLQQYRQHSHP